MFVVQLHEWKKLYLNASKNMKVNSMNVSGLMNNSVKILLEKLNNKKKDDKGSCMMMMRIND